MSIFKSERELIEEQLLNIMGRHIDLESEENKWLFTIGKVTYASKNYVPKYSRGFVKIIQVSFDEQIAIVVNAFNALHERNWLIDYKGMFLLEEQEQK